VIDPEKVTKIALKNAASVAGISPTTECALFNLPEENADGAEKCLEEWAAACQV
jgi:chaperonin GroEL